MTKEQAEIILLKRALDQACNSVEFLEGCVIDGIDKGGVYNYVYPEQIKALLAEWRELSPERKDCPHSNFDKSCESCQVRNKNLLEWREARKIIG